MRLTTIGTGSAAPARDRVGAAHLVETGGVRLLMDCGSGAVFRMANLGIDWMSITHICFSHFHADHVSDLPTLLFAWRYGAIPWRTAPARIVGPVGTVRLVEALDQAFGGKFAALGFTLEITEMEPGARVRLDEGVDLASLKVPHTDESVAYSVEAGRRRIVYTGDTGPDPELASWAAGSDVLIMECSLPADLAIDTHLTPERCAEMAALTQPGALVLTHFYPPVEEVDIAGIVGSAYRGPIHVARDGWSVELED